MKGVIGMQELTGRQKEIFNFLKKEIKERGYPPSVREIGAAVGLKSSSTVHGYLSQLQDKGYIRKDPVKPRAIEVLVDDDNIENYNNRYVDEKLRSKLMETVNVPFVGEITAGEPILADEKIEEYYPLPVEFANDEDSFVLTVRGDSMIEAGIFEGDLLIVKKQNNADNGDIVVALIEDEATVKRFFKASNHIRLQPENSNMEPIFSKEVQILGKVTGLIRKY